MKKTNKFLFIVCAGLAITKTQTIQQSTAAFISAGVGIGAGSLYYFGKHEWDRNSFISSLVAIGTAGLTYLIMRELTPEVKFERARSLLLKVEKGLFFGRYVVNKLKDRDLFEMMHKTYITYDLPYAVAYHDLTRKLNQLKSAENLFESVKEEGNCYLKQDATDYLNQIPNIVENITNALSRIKKTKEFVEQIKIYEERRLAEQRLAIEDRKASAKEREAWAKQQQANAKDREVDAKEREVAVKEQQAHAAEWGW